MLVYEQAKAIEFSIYFGKRNDNVFIANTLLRFNSIFEDLGTISGLVYYTTIRKISLEIKETHTNFFRKSVTASKSNKSHD